MATLLFARRIAECADKSWMLAWQSVLYFFVINLLAALGLPDVVAAWKTDLERCMSRLSGVASMYMSSILKSLLMQHAEGLHQAESCRLWHAYMAWGACLMSQHGQDAPQPCRCSAPDS